jgi:uncharacterized protein YdeI (YjbR/CyaY-like superfamily)
MASVIPDPKRIRAFESQAAFEKWLGAHHDAEPEVFLRIHKKGSGVASVTYDEALDVALCWGWIDGIRKAYDAASFLQRFTPRRPKSVWSTINRDRVARLIAQRRMTPHGMRHVEAAKLDGRWDAAYDGQARMQLPDELRAAIAASPKAQATFETLDKANLYALAWRLHTLKTEAGKQKKLVALVSMLERGETIHPIKAKPKK